MSRFERNIRDEMKKILLVRIENGVLNLFVVKNLLNTSLRVNENYKDVKFNILVSILRTPSQKGLKLLICIG